MTLLDLILFIVSSEIFAVVWMPRKPHALLSMQTIVNDWGALVMTHVMSVDCVPSCFLNLSHHSTTGTLELAGYLHDAQKSCSRTEDLICSTYVPMQ